jgi:hypothetical protein
MDSGRWHKTSLLIAVVMVGVTGAAKVLEADNAPQRPNVVPRLKALFEQMEVQVPDLPVPKSRYLFRHDGKGRRPLMRLIGGELRYDKIPKPQRHLLKTPADK